MNKFVPGLKLSRLFYQRVVKQILEQEFPKLKYSVALIGSGSEVLGFDTAISVDHHWGPRMLLFLSEKDYSKCRNKIKNILSRKLPRKFLGFSTDFGNPDKIGVQLLEEKSAGPVRHRIEIYTIRSFFKNYLEIDPYGKIDVADWLTFPQQKLLSIVDGAVFFDGLGELNKIRNKFKYYSKDVWFYMLVAQWSKIGQEESFIGRAGDVGDEVGSKIIATRLVRELMMLCFLMEKQYAPYSKWLGTAFVKLKCAKRLIPIFNKVFVAKSWKEREGQLSRVYIEVAQMHNLLKITKQLSVQVSKFHNRPYLIIHAENFAEQIKKKIRNRAVKKIKFDIGSIDQFSDSTDFVANFKPRHILKKLYS